MVAAVYIVIINYDKWINKIQFLKKSVTFPLKNVGTYRGIYLLTTYKTVLIGT